MKRIALVFLAAYAGSIFLQSFTIGGLGSMTRLIGYVAFIVGGAAMLSQKGVQRPGAGHVLLTMFVSFSLVSVLWSIDPDMTLDRTWMYTMQLIFLWLVLQLLESQEDMNVVMGGYVVGSVIACLGNFYVFRAGQQIAENTGRYSSTDYDPNEFALTVVLSIPMAWYLGFSARRPMARLLFKCALFVMIPGVILTGSRGGAVAMMVSLLIIPLCFKQVGSSTKLIVAGAVLAATVSGLALVPEATLKRLSSIGHEAMGGSMAGRRDIWIAGWEVFKEHPILGVGTGGFPQSINFAYARNPVAHNTYLSVATELGSLGFLIFFFAILQMNIEIFKMPKPERWLWGVVLLTWMVGVCTLTWEHTKTTWLIFSLILTRARLFKSEWEIPIDESELSTQNVALPVAR